MRSSPSGAACYGHSSGLHARSLVKSCIRQQQHNTMCLLFVLLMSTAFLSSHAWVGFPTTLLSHACRGFTCDMAPYLSQLVHRRVPEGDESVREVRISCPDATGLGCDIARMLLDFGLRILTGDLSTDGTWCYLVFVVRGSVHPLSPALSHNRWL